MSTDNDPNTRYVIQRVDDEFYWNGRGWTRFLKLATRFVYRTFAVQAQDGFHPTRTRIVKVTK